jgi:hypothetical protein
MPCWDDESFIGHVASHVRHKGSPLGGNDGSQCRLGGDLFLLVSILVGLLGLANTAVSGLVNTPRHVVVAPVELLASDLFLLGLSRKCRHFQVRQKLLLKTSVRVFPTRRPDTRTCRRHHAVLGFFMCVVFCVVLSIADMSIRAVEMS